MTPFSKKIREGELRLAFCDSSMDLVWSVMADLHENAANCPACAKARGELVGLLQRLEAMRFYLANRN